MKVPKTSIMDDYEAPDPIINSVGQSARSTRTIEEDAPAEKVPNRDRLDVSVLIQKGRLATMNTSRLTIASYSRFSDAALIVCPHDQKHLGE